MTTLARRLSGLTLTALLSMACYGDIADPYSGTWQLAWSDEFDGPAGQLPNPANWGFDVGTDWGNAQLEYDTNRPDNASLDGNGNLAIVARRESFSGSAYTSARLTSLGKRDQQQGRFEARIRVPTTSGIWPAFWLLGSNCATVGWPTCGEIDIMEHFGRLPSTISGSMHGPGYSGGNAVTRTFSLPGGARFDSDFHVFRVDWTADRVSWFVDDSLYQVIRRQDVPGTWVFDHPFYVIINLAVGGNPVGAPGAGTTFPQTMLVDWVRVYEPAR